MSTTSPIAPSIGRVVIVSLPLSMRPQPDDTEAPGIINKVFTNDCINVALMPSGHAPWPATSITYDDAPSDSDTQMTWHWMDYQLKVAADRDPVSGEPANTTT